MHIPFASFFTGPTFLIINIYNEMLTFFLPWEIQIEFALGEYGAIFSL